MQTHVKVIGLALCAASVLGLGVALWEVGPAENDIATAQSSTSSELASANARMRRIERELAVQRRGVRSAAMATRGSEPASVENLDSPSAADERDPGEVHQQPAEPQSFEEARDAAFSRAQDLEQELIEQTPDASWAKEAKLAARGAATELDINVSDLRCGSTLCSLRFSPDSRTSDLERLSEAEPFSHGGYAYIDPDTAEAIVYFVREGESLPGEA